MIAWDERQSLGVDGDSLIYDGAVTQDAITELSDRLKDILEADIPDRKAQRNIFAVFVEMIENIYRYAPDGMGRLVISGRSGDIRISMSNAIANDQIERMTSRLGEIRAMSTDDIKARYKQKLREPQEATSKGAGVGFFEIARRGKGPISFLFEPLDDGQALFTVFTDVAVAR